MIKFGVVGIGLRGRLFADTIVQNPYANLVAICDSNEQSLRHAITRYKDVKTYQDAQQMMNEEALDAVVVATPDFLHKLPVMLAAERDIHVMVEKPFSTRVEEAEEMAEAVKQSGIKCMVAFENRWNPPFVNVSERIHRGDLGRIVAMNSRLNDTIYVPTKMLKWSNHTSPGWFLLSHSIDLACYWKQAQPVTVYAVGTKQKLVAMGMDTYDSIQAMVTFADQTSATFTSSWILPESLPMMVDFKFEIIGEEGALYVDLHDQMVQQAGAVYEHVPTVGTSINGRLLAPPNHMLDAFIDNIRLNTEPLAGPKDGLINTKLVDAIHRSVESGDHVKI